MLEVVIKLSAMLLGGRKRVLYYTLLQLLFQQTYVTVSAFRTFMAKHAAFWKLTSDS